MKIYTILSSLASSILALASCKNSHQQRHDGLKPHLFVEGIALSIEEEESLAKLAENGDSKAATRLAHHFSLVVYDQEKARHWLHQAAIFGGEREKKSYESFIEGYKK